MQIVLASLFFIEIPHSVTHIGIHPFATSPELRPSSLKNFKVSWDTPLGLTDEIPDLIIGIPEGYWYYISNNVPQCTLLVPQGTKLLYEEARHWKDFGKIEEYVPLGTNSASPASQVQAAVVGNRLCVDSPDAEDITVYSITGAVLATYRKPAGQAWFVLPFNIQTMVIVKGSSGWRRKVSG